MSAVCFPGSIGVCNGRMADNLPSAQDVVELYKSYGIKRMRLYHPDEPTLRALQGSDIELILDVPNADLQSLQSESDATHWVQENVRRHFPATKIRYIAVGNEVDPGNPETESFVPLVLPAMRHISEALSDLKGIKVSTATYSALLTDTSRPSNVRFRHLRSFMEPIIHFLAQTGAPLLANIYPYFAYVGDKSGAVKLDFALFTSQTVQVMDRGLKYQNLFDTMVDGVYYALENAGGQNVGVVVSESGWPSAGGGEAESVANANAYYQRLMKHVADGTPKKQGQALETYLFAMFDENQKPGNTTARNFGADNLPSERDVVELYKFNGIKRMRIYGPNQATLTALRDSDIQLILDVPNVDLQSLQSESDATHWVQTNVTPYFPATKIRYIAVGNEVDPEKPETSRLVPLVLPAMRNIYKALSELGLQDAIKVSTATYSALLTNTSPPPNARFKDLSFMEPIIHFLARTGTPLLANIYPYVTDNSGAVKLDYALFTSRVVVYMDYGLEYENLFDATVDGVYYALKKVGGQNVEVVVSEGGWPSAAGGEAESRENAKAYYQSLMKHVAAGETPKKRGQALETYLFVMFDENEKPENTIEQHFGLFYPDKTPKYQLIA